MRIAEIFDEAMSIAEQLVESENAESVRLKSHAEHALRSLRNPMSANDLSQLEESFPAGVFTEEVCELWSVCGGGPVVSELFWGIRVWGIDEIRKELRSDHRLDLIWPDQLVPIAVGVDHRVFYWAEIFEKKKAASPVWLFSIEDGCIHKVSESVTEFLRKHTEMTRDWYLLGLQTGSSDYFEALTRYVELWTTENWPEAWTSHPG